MLTNLSSVVEEYSFPVDQIVVSVGPYAFITLTLITSSSVSMSLEHAFLPESENYFGLPLPSKNFAEKILKTSATSSSQEDFSNYLVSIWAAYNGVEAPFNQLYWTNIAKKWISRASNLTNSNNHRFAISSSPISRTLELQSLNIPTLIIHGSSDPFFSLEHAYALNKAISNSKLAIVEKMGHLLQESCVEEIMSNITTHLTNNAS